MELSMEELMTDYTKLLRTKMLLAESHRMDHYCIAHCIALVWCFALASRALSVSSSVYLGTGSCSNLVTLSPSLAHNYVPVDQALFPRFSSESSDRKGSLDHSGQLSGRPGGL